jgi:hypothetical protein
MKTLVTKTSLLVALLCVGVGAFPAGARAQASSPVAPTLIPVSGRLVGADGQPRTGQASLVISLYNAQNDVSPRWVEQQTVTLDATGAYTVQFGATLQDGLPSDLFATEGGARWLGVAVRETEGDVEQPRVMLVSVPYAAKAATAETLGGKTASEFVLTSTLRDDLRTVLEEEGVTTGGGDVNAAAVNYLQKGAVSGTADSIAFDTGSRIGIGTTSPAAKMHVVDNSGATAMQFENSAASGVGLFVNMSNASHNDNGLQISKAGTLGNYISAGPLVVKGTGAVGVGTTNPNARLHIVDNSGGTAMRFESNATQGIALLLNVTNASHNDNGLQITKAGTLGNFMSAGPLTVKGNGNVGIGTGSPTSKLHVVGDGLVTGNLVVDGNIGAKYQDVAEWVDSAEPLDGGSVVIIDTTANNRVKASTAAYDGRVAGAVSAQPGLILGEGGPGRVLVAQSGRVKVKADAKYGAIRPGDLLVTSPTKGHVMRSRPMKVGEQLVHRPGTLIGKALEGLPSGRGEILVLLTLQ